MDNLPIHRCCLTVSAPDVVADVAEVDLVMIKFDLSLEFSLCSLS